MASVQKILCKRKKRQFQTILFCFKKQIKSVLLRRYLGKVEKILKGSLDFIQSPSVKIQIIGGKVCLRYKGKTLLGHINTFFVSKNMLTMSNNILPLHLKQTFPHMIWILRKVKVMGLNPSYILKPFLHYVNKGWKLLNPYLLTVLFSIISNKLP